MISSRQFRLHQQRAMSLLHLATPRLQPPSPLSTNPLDLRATSLRAPTTSPPSLFQPLQTLLRMSWLPAALAASLDLPHRRRPVVMRLPRCCPVPRRRNLTLQLRESRWRIWRSRRRVLVYGRLRPRPQRLRVQLREASLLVGRRLMICWVRFVYHISALRNWRTFSVLRCFLPKAGINYWSVEFVVVVLNTLLYRPVCRRIPSAPPPGGVGGRGLTSG